MLKTKNLVLLYALTSICGSLNALAAEKIVIDEETVNILNDNYRIYNEANAMKMARSEIALQIFHAPGQTKELFQNLQSVVMPICDTDRPPFEWKFIAPTQGERVLKYIGAQGVGSQFLRWTESVWIRISGVKERFREGMYCGHPFTQKPMIENYVAIEIDQSFSENVRNKNTPLDLIDGAILQIASKVAVPESRQMKGEVTLTANGLPPDAQVGVEIWSIGSGGPKMVASVWKTLPSTLAQKIEIEAAVEGNQEAHLLVRLEPKLRDKAAKAEVTGRILLLDARLFRSR